MLYLIKTTLVLATLLAVYHLFLEREKMHRFNRFYLLSGLVLAFATPLITVGTVDPVATTSFIAVAPTMISEVQSNIIYETEKGIDWLQFIIYGYGLITLIMFLRFINNIGILLLKSRRNPIVNHNGYKVVLIEDIGLPHTFLNYIFINRLDYESGHVEDELFTHEFAHADQWHSLDIILIELVHVFYWFNPLVYLYKKAIQLNHEFLADEEVVQSILEVPAYQNLLLDKAKCTNQVYLASNLNFQVTKKRLIMMTKPLSKRRNIIYGLMVIPLAIGLVSCFGEYNTPFTKTGTYINYVSPDEFNVTFTGMKQEDLDAAQIELRNEGIEIEYFKTTMDPDRGLVAMDFHIDFGNGNSITTDLLSKNDFRPHGITVNRSAGTFCSGYIEQTQLDSKSSTLQRMRNLHAKGANFTIKEKDSSYHEAVTWLRKTTYWQANMYLSNKETGQWTVQLESSISFNPFKKIKCLFQDWMPNTIMSESNTSESEALEDPIIKQYIDFQFPNPTIHFEDKLISMEKLVEYSYMHEDLCVSGTKNADGTSDVRINL